MLWTSGHLTRKDNGNWDATSQSVRAHRNAEFRYSFGRESQCRHSTPVSFQFCDDRLTVSRGLGVSIEVLPKKKNYSDASESIGSRRGALFAPFIRYSGGIEGSSMAANT